MQFFNKNFFRFAFGFIGIIVLSMSLILIVGVLKEQQRADNGTPASPVLTRQ